jgi:RNA polymerase sigma-B factor
MSTTPALRSAAGVERLTRGGLDTPELFERWQEHGDARARELLVERFMPVARKLAWRYRGAREPIEDLVQVASVGLLNAIDRFDATRGTSFTSFAVPTIIGEIKRYFRDLGWSVHVPRSSQELALKVENAQRRLMPTIGRSPTVQELAQYLELSVEDVLDALEASAAHHSTSLDAPREDGNEEVGTLADSLGTDDERFELIEFGATIAPAARQLTERERRVLALRFLEDLTQSEIAERIGVSQMQVSRILRQSVARLGELVADGGVSS